MPNSPTATDRSQQLKQADATTGIAEQPLVIVEMIESEQPINLPQGPPLLVLGNGRRGQVDTTTATHAFTFNNPRTLDVQCKQIHVQMRRDATGMHRLTLESTGRHEEITNLEHRLNHSLDQQSLTLGCLPSCGYALIHGLWSSHDSVMVDGICFDPSLARPADLGHRKPLPQAFHNWLGERRTTFRRWLTEPPFGWSWPMIDGLNVIGSPEEGCPQTASVHHTQLLAVMLESAKTGSMRPLEGIARSGFEPSSDLLETSPQMTQLEQMFHLSRTQSDTPNWWLFDAEASILIEQITQRLRRAQFLAFSHVAIGKGVAE